MPEIPIEDLTTKQAAHATLRQLATITERLDRMSDELSHLSASVDKELADDAAQNELIAELKAQLEAAKAAADAAAAGEADAQANLSDALSKAQDAANRLDSNDAPA